MDKLWYAYEKILKATLPRDWSKRERQDYIDMEREDYFYQKDNFGKAKIPGSCELAAA